MKNNTKEPNRFRPLPFYHPRPDNKGYAASFSYNTSEDKLYLNILKQSSWDTATNRGTFSGENKTVIKFSSNEAAQLAFIIGNNNGVFNVTHEFNGIANNIVFFKIDNLNFRFEIFQRLEENKNNNILVELSDAEIYKLKLYIDAAIQDSFYNF